MPVGFYDTTKQNVYKRSHPLSKAIKLLGADTAPFLHAIQHIAPEPNKHASVSEGVSWTYAEKAQGQKAKNAHIEGADPSQVEYYVQQELKNQYQISKVSYGLTRTAIKQRGLEGLDFQSERAFEGLMNDVNFALIKNTAAVQRTDAKAGETCGLYGLFGSHNEVDGNSQPISSDLLEDVCSMALNNGVRLTHFMVSDKQAKGLNKIFRDTYRTEYGQSRFLGTDIVEIGNIRGLKNSVKRLYEPLVEETDIILFDINDFGLILFDELKNDELPEKSDKKEWQHLMEYALYYASPKSLFRIKNLAV